MPEKIDLGRFEPLHSAHAIEQVVFVVQFETPMDTATVTDLIKLAAEQFKVDLPGFAEIQGFRFAIGGPFQNAKTIPTQGSGAVLNRTAPDGSVQAELSIEPGSLTFRTTTYTRWVEVWGTVCKYFTVLLPICVSKTKVSALGLSYVDKFVWQGNSSTWAPNLLLRTGSSYLCPVVFSAPDLWHSHTGAFSKADAQTKRLTNVNVDCLDESVRSAPRRVVAISTVLTDLLNQSGYEPFNATAETVNGLVTTRMAGLHIASKAAFGEVINEEMTKRVALVG